MYSTRNAANPAMRAPSTVKTYVSRLLRKTDSRSRAQLAARAHEWGVVVG